MDRRVGPDSPFGGGLGSLVSPFQPTRAPFLFLGYSWVEIGASRASEVSRAAEVPGLLGFTGLLGLMSGRGHLRFEGVGFGVTGNSGIGGRRFLLLVLVRRSTLAAVELSRQQDVIWVRNPKP